MCGILGSVNHLFNQSNLGLLKHRGPDDFGLNSFFVNKNTIMLGHRRLSIIDTSPAGHQPMISSCKNYAIIFNGEIYNHLQLRDQLSVKVEYKGHSDTESIMYYLIEKGIKGVKDFNGIFSFAFLDMKKNKLFIVRDPFGVKPLYYYVGKDSQLIFSSEIRTITSLIDKSNLNEKAMASLLRLRFCASPDTLYDDIFKLQPGHYLEIDLDKTIKLQSIPFIGAQQRGLKKERKSFVSEYGAQLEAAVKRQLLSDVEIGVLLSGGIDSALVAALAQKHYSGKLKAFTIGFEGDHDEDEIKDAAITAELLGLEHYYRRISFTDFLGMIKKCSEIIEEPLGTTSVIPLYYLSELASSMVKVVLTGQGADEPLGGYTRYKLELLRDKLPAVIRQSIFPFIARINLKNEQISRGLKAINITDTIGRFLASYEIFTNDEIYGLIGANDTLSYHRIAYYYNLLKCKDIKQPVERMITIDLHLNLTDDLLNCADKITMHHSLECRVPMLDLKLVNFIQSVPTFAKLNLKQGKLIHKKFAESILPNEIIYRKKKGFKTPTYSWFRQEADAIREILLADENLFAKIFNKGSVEKIIKRHQDGFNMEKQIFLLLSIFYFLESYSDNRKPQIEGQ